MKIEGDYAIIETAEEACCFRVSRWLCWQTASEVTTAVENKRVTRAQVLEVITPNEGDAVFWWFDERDPLTEDWHPNEVIPQYSIYDGGNYWAEDNDSRRVKVNALTIGKTVGELRELLEWCALNQTWKGGRDGKYRQIPRSVNKYGR